ncbi:unnamed protein product [Hydatigera taeniaeformis]|uniref:FBD domain-containing protein n=1 Tax=Hydatigena taeniaeformis TaxID=6205 RepID=A0A0R3WSV0_HYDTA|nr:unnamed protein product [Hydatigera taeniaeformis]
MPLSSNPHSHTPSPPFQDAIFWGPQFVWHCETRGIEKAKGEGVSPTGSPSGTLKVCRGVYARSGNIDCAVFRHVVKCIFGTPHPREDAAVADECVAKWGAVIAGGADIIGRLEVGAFHWDEYDDVVAHPDFAEVLHKLRKLLRNRMPTLKNGRMGENVIELLRAQQLCVLLSSVPVEGVPEINEIELVLGQLSWEDSHLEDNLHCYLEAIDAAKSARLNGDVLERVELLCPPCGEIFQLNEMHTSGEKRPAEVEESDEEEGRDSG